MLENTMNMSIHETKPLIPNRDFKNLKTNKPIDYYNYGDV